MDYIGATPQSNPIMGLLAERLKQAQQFATRPFGYQNPPAEMLLNLLGVPAVQQTAERLAYGEPLTTGRGMTTQIRPEVAEAALTVAPMAGLLGRGAEKAAMAAGRAGERYAERVVPQIMEKGGIPAQLLQDLSQGSIRPMDVWHGSPHGPFTKFDPTKIGSGEGAQAFSYGHYLGEARGTGEEYRRMLSTKVDVDGKPLYDANKIVGSTGNADLDDYLVANLGDVTAARKNILDDIKYVAEGNPEAAKEMQKTLDALDNLKVDKKEAGYLYKVDLPDEAIANMLDWDKPVSKQPNVMKALRSEAEQRVRDRKIVDIENDIRASLPSSDIGDDYLSMFSDANVGINQDIQKQALEKLNKMDLKPLVDKELDSMKPADMNWSMTGKEFYELLSKREGSPEKASGLLQRQGVPGTRYLDQQSRTPGGSDTSNFVVYPGGEDLLTIKEINDKPVGGLLGQSKAAFTYPQEEAMRLAQRRAALPVEQGGLGLAADNTAEQRAAAMGFDLENPQYHATDVDFTSIKPSSRGKMGAGIYSSPDAQYAEKYAPPAEKRTLPLVSKGYYADADKRSQIFDQVRENAYANNPDITSRELHDLVSQEMQNRQYSGFDVDKERLTFNPDDIRSRFAAFDPFRRNAAIAAAMGVAAPNLLAEEQEPKKKRNLLD